MMRPFFIRLKEMGYVLRVSNSMCASNVHCASPTQNMVDMFEMADGRAIKDAGADYDDQNPYVNRDPRFYYDILYNGVKWGNNKGVPHYFELWEYNTYDNLYQGSTTLS